jgi:hypothetical protein
MEQSELRELEKEQNSPLLKPNYGKVPVYVLERRKEVAAKVAQLAKEKALANQPANRGWADAIFVAQEIRAGTPAW